MTANPQAMATTATVEGVTLTDPENAEVKWTLLMNGAPVLPDQSGAAIQEDGTWKVTATTFCTLLAIQGGGRSRPGLLISAEHTNRRRFGHGTSDPEPAALLVPRGGVWCGHGQRRRGACEVQAPLLRCSILYSCTSRGAEPVERINAPATRVSSFALPSIPSRTSARRMCRCRSCSAVNPIPPSTCWQ